MSERLRFILALDEPGRMACLLVRVYLVELGCLDPASLPAIRWPGLLAGRQRQPGQQIEPRAETSSGAGLPQLAGRSIA